MICCTAAISWSLDNWWDAPDNLFCNKSNVFIFNPSMMFLVGDLLQYGLLCTLSIASHVFTCSILETGFYFCYQMQGRKVSLQSQLKLSLLTPDHFQNVVLEKCQYVKQCPKISHVYFFLTTDNNAKTPYLLAILCAIPQHGDSRFSIPSFLKMQHIASYSSTVSIYATLCFRRGALLLLETQPHCWRY